jgi:transcriptional regulator with XRE-family HTH domain
MGDTYSKRLRWCLAKASISRALLATASGLSTVTVQSIARGVRGKDPGADTSRKLADALVVSWEWLALGNGLPPSTDALAARGIELRKRYPPKRKNGRASVPSVSVAEPVVVRGDFAPTAEVA